MSDDSTTQCLLFPGMFCKAVVAQFDQREGSSDGGALLLKAADRRYGLLEELTACLRDQRQAGKVDQGLRELLAQRVFSIACGYPDANDCARLASDPIHKLLLDRDPVEGRDLASQPTLSRFENGVGVKELYRMGEALAVSVIRRHAQRLRRRANRVTIDLDPTDDPTHGAQQLSFFNGHYDNWCYLPVLGFVSYGTENAPLVVIQPREGSALDWSLSPICHPRPIASAELYAGCNNRPCGPFTKLLSEHNTTISDLFEGPVAPDEQLPDPLPHVLIDVCRDHLTARNVLNRTVEGTRTSWTLAGIKGMRFISFEPSTR